jgi:hypothetical protein
VRLYGVGVKFVTVLSIPLILAGGLAGLLAAYYWFGASRAQIKLSDCESGATDVAQNGWIDAIAVNIAESSRLSGKAAGWTAVAVALGAIGGILSVIPVLVR